MFLSGATNRWDVLKKHLAPTKAKIPKPLCTLRWSSRVNAVKPLCKNPGAIIAALKEIRESDSYNAIVRLEAGSLVDKIDFAYICSSVLWYDILSHVNIASKSLQSVKSNIQTALLVSLESVLAFLLKYNENGFEKVLAEAIEVCQLKSIETKFDEQQRISAGRITVRDEVEFEKKVFSPIIESAINSITQRSEGKSDIDADEVFAELTIVSTLIEEYEIFHAIDILDAIYTQNMENLVPNAVIAFRILLTIPVSVASGERSFSKLKLIKTYLRNSMGQDRLNELAIISIEKEIANSIDYDDVIEYFASKKARKKEF